MRLVSTLLKKNWTLAHLLRQQAQVCPEKTFLRFEGIDYSYRKADTLSDSLANGLRALGVGKGIHIGLLMNNHPEMVWSIIALAKIGAVVVMLNTSARGEMLRYFLDQSDILFLIADSELIEEVRRVTSGMPKPPLVIVNGPSSKTDVALAGLYSNQSPVPNSDFPAFDDVQLMMYTSGTTGPSKGVLCTYAQNAAAGRDIVLANKYEESDVLFTCLPLFHANALRATMTAAIWLGATCALSRKFSARNFWNEIIASGATVFNALGAMVSILQKNSQSPQERAHSVKKCCVVPSLSPQDTRIFEERFSARLTSLYGSTEIGCPIYTGLNTPIEKWPTCGQCLPSYEAKIVDEYGFEKPAGEAGELLIRPRDPAIGFAGYYKMPEATVNTNKNYWFHTGDRCHQDSEGFFYFIDRIKECIRRRGENVSSFELEAIICRLDWVKEVAVVPVPSPLGEDDIFAFIVRAPGINFSESALIEYCERSMSTFMIPRYVTFLDSLPRNSSEKIEKFKLKEMALSVRDQCWDREKHTPQPGKGI